MKRLVLTSFLAISLSCNGLAQAMSSDFYYGFLTASASITGLGIGFYCCYKKLTKQCAEPKQSIRRDSNSHNLQEQIKRLQAEKQQLALQLNQIQITQKNQTIVASQQEHTFAAIVQSSLQDKYSQDKFNALQQELLKCQKEKDDYFSLNHILVEGIKKSNQVLQIPLIAHTFEPFLVPSDFEPLKKEGLKVKTIKKKGTYYVTLSAITSTQPAKQSVNKIWPSSAEPTSSSAIPAAGGSPNSSN